MKAICIRKSHPGYCKWDLTPGKTYDVLEQGKDNNTEEPIYLIQDDEGNTYWYSKITVMPIDEWREKRLKEIGI